jgi:hypothetical protein
VDLTRPVPDRLCMEFDGLKKAIEKDGKERKLL